jgi:DUF1680 family protein
MPLSRRHVLLGLGALALPPGTPLGAPLRAANGGAPTDRVRSLPPRAVELRGVLGGRLDRTRRAWVEGAVPYDAFAEFFRTGRPVVHDAFTDGELFATGEMWGKAVRTAALVYRYDGGPALAGRLARTVADVLASRRTNGTISASPVERQPDGPMGELWERGWTLTGLDEYYRSVRADPAVLAGMVAQADATLAQVGRPPRARIVDLGWSVNRIESSTILAPILRVHALTRDPRYLAFARYVVAEGGAKGHDLVAEVLAGRPPVEVGGIYPKAYEMLAYFRGIADYYRATGGRRWRDACLTLYRAVAEREITIVGNGGADLPYHPNAFGEAWDETAAEQTNPDLRRMMETCVGVSWLEFCLEILRLTGDPRAVDLIERYAYNGLLGAMKPEGDGFSYVNRLDGVKNEPRGWGATVAGVYVTCCNLSGPTGLALLPTLAAMRDDEGVVVNLYESGRIALGEPAEGALEVDTAYPVDGTVRLRWQLREPRRQVLRLRIPAFSERTELTVRGRRVAAPAGTYVRLDETWSPGEEIALTLDLRCRLLRARRGSGRGSDRFVALTRGPLVLARAEALDPRFDAPVEVLTDGDVVGARPVAPTRPGTLLELEVPTRAGPIRMVDYASVDGWSGQRLRTWLPLPA